MHHVFILFSVLLFGCSTPRTIDYVRLKDITFGTPVVVGSTLHIPVDVCNGTGFIQPVEYLCGVSSEVNGQTIEFSMLRCSHMHYIGTKRALISTPRVSLPYTGPATYQMVYVGPNDTKTPVGQVSIGE